MRLKIFYRPRKLPLALLLLLPSLVAQDRPIVSLDTPARITVQHGAAVKIPLPLKIAAGYHINSNKPTDEYMIPLTLTWDRSMVFEAGAPVFPKAPLEKYPFSDQPISVYTNSVVIETPGKVASSAAPGTVTLTGKLRYQGCSDRLCYPPKTLSLSIPIEIK